MSDSFDDAMNATAQQLSAEEVERQTRAAIPALKVFRVTRSRLSEDSAVFEQYTTEVIAHSMMPDRSGKNLLFGTIQFQSPGRLMNMTTRVLGGPILDAEDAGAVVSSRIIH